MTEPLLQRVPMVAGLAYVERVRRLPSSLTVSLRAEAENRYFLHAIAVIANGEKVGFVAPEVARRFHAAILAQLNLPTCQARRASIWDHQTSGVELILDFSSLPVEPEP